MILKVDLNKNLMCVREELPFLKENPNKDYNLSYPRLLISILHTYAVHIYIHKYLSKVFISGLTGQT